MWSQAPTITKPHPLNMIPVLFWSQLYFISLHTTQFMAHRSHSPAKADDTRLLEQELSPNPPMPEETTATASPAQEAASASPPSPPSLPSPPKPKSSPQKSKGSPLKIRFPSPGKVREMISKIERSRSHTLPTSPRSPKAKGSSRFKAFKSEGGTPLLDSSPTKRLGLLQSYAVPIKGGDGGNADGNGGAENHFVGSKSLPDYEPSFFDRAMKSSASSATSLTSTPLNSSNPMLSVDTPTIQPQTQVSEI